MYSVLVDYRYSFVIVLLAEPHDSPPIVTCQFLQNNKYKKYMMCAISNLGQPYICFLLVGHVGGRMNRVGWSRLQ